MTCLLVKDYMDCNNDMLVNTNENIKTCINEYYLEENNKCTSCRDVILEVLFQEIHVI